LIHAFHRKRDYNDIIIWKSPHSQSFSITNGFVSPAVGYEWQSGHWKFDGSFSNGVPGGTFSLGSPFLG